MIRKLLNFVRKATKILDGSSYIGTEKTFSNVYEAIKFTAPSAMQMHGLKLKLKRSGSISNYTAFLQAQIWGDSGGKPDSGNKLTGPSTNDEQAMKFGFLSTSYKDTYLYFSKDLSISLSASTDYWLVLYRSAAPTGGGSIISDSTTGTNKHAYSTDGSSWINENYQCYFEIMKKPVIPIEVENDFEAGLKATIKAGNGFVADIVRGIALYLKSSESKALFCSSDFDWAGYFSAAYGHSLYSFGLMSVPQMNELLLDGTLLDFAVGGAQSVVGNITVSSGTVSYNAFRGDHYFQLSGGQNENDFKPGHVLVATGSIIPCEASANVSKLTDDNLTDPISGEVLEKQEPTTSDKQYFSYVSHTTTAGDKRVYGVYGGKLCNTADKGPFGENSKAIHTVVSLGLWKIRVTDTNGDIEPGDFLESSTRSGEAQKQTATEFKNSTVAKAITGVTWAGETTDPELGYKWKLIPASIHAG